MKKQQVKGTLLDVASNLIRAQNMLDVLKKSPGPVHADIDPLVTKIERAITEALELVEHVRGKS
jgi:hypothetical protein